MKTATTVHRIRQKIIIINNNEKVMHKQQRGGNYFG
jgi:hypothetical protein